MGRTAAACLSKGAMPAISPTKISFRPAMTIEAPFHLQRLLLIHERHAIDLTVTRRAADAFVNVDAVIETRNPEHYREIIESLEKEGFPTRLLSNLSVGDSI